MKRLALFSCSHKYKIDSVANFLADRDYKILCSGGTYNYLLDTIILKDRLISVEDYTNSKEILSGRVKTLHPKIHAGILFDRKNDEHINELRSISALPIDVVVTNFYPFERTAFKTRHNKKGRIVKSHVSNDDVVLQQLDIGGIALTRAAAKNFKYVSVLTDPNQYATFIEDYDHLSDFDRMSLASSAFARTHEYELSINRWFNKRRDDMFFRKGITRRFFSSTSDNCFTRKYDPVVDLKYGSNPHQYLSELPSGGARLYKIGNNAFPFKILNGNVSYINVLDALNGWQLVSELCLAFNRPAAASFKHTSPAGAAVALNSKESVFDAYLKARNGDPVSSFGDFIAVSDNVSIDLAKYIKGIVSDGIIAPGYDKSALNILKRKKKGKYVVMKATVNSKTRSQEELEFREMCGIALSQPINRERITLEDFNNDNIVTSRKTGTQKEKQNLLLANTTLKYAQSNNVALAYDGQIIGISAGQQSRIHSVRLSVSKAKVWLLNNDGQINMLFDWIKSLLSDINSQEFQNFKIRLIEHCLGERLNTQEYVHFSKKFNFKCEILDCVIQIIESAIKKYDFKKTKGISLASDAFFPFRDNIDCASNIGVSAVAQPGGSLRDEDVIQACNDHNMIMYCHGKRMFTH